MADPLSDPIQQRLPDGGPRYVETPADPIHYAGWAAEPWNTVSAFLFVLIAAGWAWKLRGRYRQYPFLTMCIPILLTGGIGGVLYHGLRTQRVYFLMDLMPISILGLAITMWLWLRLGPRVIHLIGVLALVALLQVVSRQQLPIQWAINVSYASLALTITVPIVLCLIRTRFQQAGWVYTALACFAIAWVCRIGDTVEPPVLPMGTHWLWHVFGALTTLSLSVYIYFIEQVPLRRKPA